MNLQQRLVGLVKAIDEEMQPGAREFSLAAVEELIDARDACERKGADLLAALREIDQNTRLSVAELRAIARAITAATQGEET